MKVRIVVADATDLIRLGLGAVLAARPEFLVEASVGTLAELSAAVEKKPHVMVVDERLDPDVDILKIVEQAGERTPQTRLLVSGYLRDGLLIRDLFAEGSRGYLYKGDALQEALPSAIQTVMRDRPYLSPTANAEYLVAMQTPERD